MGGEIVASLHQSITRNEQFVAGPRKERSRIIANAKGHPLRPDAMLVKKVGDPADKPEFPDITYRLSHAGQAPVNSSGTSLLPSGPADNRPLRSPQCRARPP